MPANSPALARFRSAFASLMLAAEELNNEANAMAGVPNSSPEICAIIELVAAHYRVPMVRFLSNTKDNHTAEARHVAMLLARELTPYGLSEIGIAFQRTHSAVLHAQRSMSARLDTEPVFRATIDSLREAAREALSNLKSEISNPRTK